MTMTTPDPDVLAAADAVMLSIFGPGWNNTPRHFPARDRVALALQAERDRARRKGMEEAAKIAETTLRRECPFDGPHEIEPEDPCPVCGGLGTDGAEDKCHGYVRHAIAAAIRAANTGGT